VRLGEQRETTVSRPPGPGRQAGPPQSVANRPGAPERTHPIVVNTATTITPRQDKTGFVVNHTGGNGSRVVVSTQKLHSGQQQIAAYRQTRDPAAGTETKTYLDGHRVTVGPEAITRSSPRQFTITSHRDGLRDVSLPNGKPVFRERFGTYAWRGDRAERVIIREVFTGIAAGAAVALGSHVEQIYGVLPYRGAVIYPYLPFGYPPGFYPPFLTAFGTPLTVSPGCPYCPSPMVAFAEPTASYDDPVDLVSDLVLSSAVEDGMNDALPPDAAAAPDPEVAQLAEEVETLRSQIGAAAASDDAVAALMADQTAQIESMRRTAAEPPPHPKTPVRIPEVVRQRMRQQVRQDIVLHQEKKPLSLPDIIASAEAQSYIFQISEMIDATDTALGEECALTTGDLVKFDQVPAEGEPVAQMRVVTSKAGSCRAGTTVDVSLADLQDMLNAFSQRLENTMKKVHDEVASAAPPPPAN
jgi:hypothetical protein